MKLSEMRELLSTRGIRLTKSLGQNFLHDGNQLRRIVAAAELTKSDKVLEIGPGLGPLTELLLAQTGEVLAIEKDRRLFEFLQEHFSSAKNLSLLRDDALDYLQREPRDWSDWKLVANLPYSVATAILVELAQCERGPQRMVVTLQLEVAQRLVAQAGSHAYGVLALLIQLRYDPKDHFKIPASCFFPQPDVDSACVTLIRRSRPLLTSEQSETFTKIVKRAFSQRRKMMFKLLKQDWPEERLTAAFTAQQISTGERAEELCLEEFVALAEKLD
ncbi:MAG: ribosomal RNA small subunit methyltransferase A [Verrucomicrobia bacterium]|nr:ribosomal RNA small subunit methyltransferase A [Verrucomicrobiota bacterium]